MMSGRTAARLAARGFNVSRWSERPRHIREMNTRTCDACGEWFTSAASLARHLGFTHGDLMRHLASGGHWPLCQWPGGVPDLEPAEDGKRWRWGSAVRGMALALGLDPVLDPVYGWSVLDPAAQS